MKILALALLVFAIPSKAAVLTQQSTPSGLVILVSGSTVAANGSLSISSAATAALTVVPNIFINNGNGNVGIKTAAPTSDFHVVGTSRFSGISVFLSSVASFGNSDGTNASTGYVGEYQSLQATINGAMAASGLYVDLSTLTLTAGDWEIRGTCAASIGGTTVATQTRCTISGTANTVGDTTSNALTIYGFAPVTSAAVYVPVGPYRVSVTGTSTYYLEGTLLYSTLGGATWSTDSFISARRMR